MVYCFPLFRTALRRPAAPLIRCIRPVALKIELKNSISSVQNLTCKLESTFLVLILNPSVFLAAFNNKNNLGISRSNGRRSSPVHGEYIVVPRLDDRSRHQITSLGY